MPKYRFEFPDEPDVGPIVLELENLEAAKAEAQRAMADSVMDRVIHRHDPRRLATRIYDEAGYLIAQVDFDDLVSEADGADKAQTNPPEEPGVKRSG
ncbi:hypothetical protein SAMN04488498_1156 [Mesorhizobium albiziae]|uniref:DUF6894 domain-containing protein n=1 Tax=Neomesorhizobium albiziae TaxID=335020 RepID=A0A1I4D1R1_9HYPH|nr:hypothetical protein [Mesorhizobium albiziae]GLS28428.1 hypothetical protein GCM10007937_01350 [Mesorhizobium albiziae]SFK86021.1 hypothetical protein SAMN04488498_1156 [Mesorhizobium albiziae]